MQLEGTGDGVATAVAALPAHAPTPAPVSPQEMLQEELCMWYPAGKIPMGPARMGAHGGERVPITGTFSAQHP